MKDTSSIPRTWAPVHLCISIAVFITCSLVYTKNVSALLTQAKLQKSPLDEVLTEGLSFQALIKNDECLAVIGSNLDIESLNPTLTSSAIFYSTVGEKRLKTNFDLKADFTPYKLLNSLDTKIKVGQTKLSLNTSSADDEFYSLVISNNAINKSFQIPKPGPIFLKKSSTPKENTYGFVLPRKLTGNFTGGNIFSNLIKDSKIVFLK